MMPIEPPSDLSRSERKAFRTLVRRLVERGIDPISRAGLIGDFIHLDARRADLRASEKRAKNESEAAATRALNVATAEKRRLHVELFRGAQKPKPVKTPIEKAAAISTKARCAPCDG
ncbi:hypothetical protein X739_05905 [Mesorhizobium sp. LNHC220B00]|nr:hypothetical protein [Mesorhizobium sp. LNHC220B00]ESY88041.1 hypothetical protein X739_05905 [Mesorhizobium sp. LNHC220B00]